MWGSRSLLDLLNTNEAFVAVLVEGALGAFFPRSPWGDRSDSLSPSAIRASSCPTTLRMCVVHALGCRPAHTCRMNSTCCEIASSSTTSSSGRPSATATSLHGADELLPACHCMVCHLRSSFAGLIGRLSRSFVGVDSHLVCNGQGSNDACSAVAGCAGPGISNCPVR